MRTKTVSSKGKPIFVVFKSFVASVNIIQLLTIFTIMSWKLESAEAGLGGLTPEEAARGALLHPEFQNLDDPLIVVSSYEISYEMSIYTN